MISVATIFGENIVSILLRAIAAGSVVAVGMGTFHIYTVPILTFLSQLPRTDISSDKYRPPDDDQREQLAQFPELDDLLIRVDESGGKVPGGEIVGHKFGPIGSPAMVIDESVFKDPQLLSAVVYHELGHRKRGDTVIGTIAIMGISLFSASSIWLLIGAFGLTNIFEISFTIALFLLSSRLSLLIYKMYNEKSRDAEFGADRRAVRSLGSPENMKILLNKYSKNREEDKDDGSRRFSSIIGKERHPHPEDRLDKITEEYDPDTNQ